MSDSEAQSRHYMHISADRLKQLIDQHFPFSVHLPNAEKCRLALEFCWEHYGEPAQTLLHILVPPPRDARHALGYGDCTFSLDPARDYACTPVRTFHFKDARTAMFFKMRCG